MASVFTHVFSPRQGLTRIVDAKGKNFISRGMIKNKEKFIIMIWQHWSNSLRLIQRISAVIDSWTLIPANWDNSACTMSVQSSWCHIQSHLVLIQPIFCANHIKLCIELHWDSLWTIYQNVTISESLNRVITRTWSETICNHRLLQCRSPFREGSLLWRGHGPPTIATEYWVHETLTVDAH